MKAIIKFHSENISFIPLKEEHIALINALHSFPEVAGTTPLAFRRT